MPLQPSLLRIWFAQQGVGIIVQPVEFGAVGPGLLNKLELAVDAGIEAKKINAPFGTRQLFCLQHVLGSHRRCQGRPVGTAPAQNAVAVIYFDRLFWIIALAVTRIGTPDVGPNGASLPIGVCFGI